MANMTTNQMVKLFAKVLKDAPPVKLSAKELAMIKLACKLS
jgi:hypothetical protein